MIALEIMLAVVLISTTAILFRGLHRFSERSVGWDPEGVVFATVELPGSRYATPAERQRFHDALEQELAAEPAIAAVALSSLPPISTYWITRAVRPDPAAGPLDILQVFHVLVSPTYFATLGAELSEGVGFVRHQGLDTGSGVIINEALARALWPGERAVGRRLFGAGDTTALEVIGVVRDIDFPASLEVPATPFQLYEPFSRNPWGYITVAVRGRGPSRDVIAAMTHALARVDPALPLHGATDVPTELTQNLGNTRLALHSTAVFAGTGFVLALLGIYGTVAHEVIRRRRELGIRLALGATPGSVTRTVLAHGARLVLPGLALGGLGSLAASHGLALALGRVHTAEPTALVAVCAAVAAAAFGACWLPARGAARVDPIESLRIQ